MNQLQQKSQMTVVNSNQRNMINFLINFILNKKNLLKFIDYICN